MDYVAPPKQAYPLATQTRLVWLRRLALLTTCWAFIVIMLGAYTRLVDAGLGCPDWPGCYGFITVPNEAHEIAEAEARFPHAPVEVAKGWPEMIHRYLASTLGLLIFSMAALAWKKAKTLPEGISLLNPPRKHTLILAALVVVQGLFGMWTVTLKLWPQVVTAHLLGGFTTFSLLAVLCMRLFDQAAPVTAEQKTSIRRLKPLISIATVLLVVQISLGAWVSSNYSALACTGFPACNGEMWPSMDFQDGFNVTQSIGPNYLGGVLHHDARVAVHMAHRLGALLVTVVLGITLFLAWRRGSNTCLRGPVILASGLLGVQICLGLTNVLALIPLPVAVAHNAVAALLLVACLWLAYRVWTAKTGAPVPN
ncbi:cytochrome B [Hahella sp. CCB-MM4]|uniref:COX15/CtaA family protein n=1 Tax=Hahella sp. (strain CCB-MM4) TaxID=1926491 RepID=UPI000B9C2E90|nr:COX15/CtaA family protein [Hahella sp. CCB-MM4]OZG73278.1 cytochrome B [Hahella sp. CCB-MM4]